uniref:Uncharacterized protein n=1 Tax=Rhizophora mucronata TaxID=61149 RepID=A0A2P2KZQ2_RHIMU
MFCRKDHTFKLSPLRLILGADDGSIEPSPTHYRRRLQFSIFLRSRDK